ncbi:hypothetical protein D3C72_1577190 [compost metagenome]
MKWLFVHTFARQCLANLLCRPKLVEGAHLLQVLPTEASAEPGGKVGCQTSEQCVAIPGAFLSGLFELGDASADFPVCSGHEGVHASCSGTSRGFQQRHDFSLDESVCLAFGECTRRGHVVVVSLRLCVGGCRSAANACAATL